MTDRKPHVTVLMPMRNVAAHLREAMKSVLQQSERDFEFLVIDDGSDDSSLEIARQLADERTHIIADGGHRGLVSRLNQGLDEASGTYVARMDADDVAMPQRLARQRAYMEAHPEVAICGSLYRAVKNGKTAWEAAIPEGHDRLRAMTIFSSPLAHGTVMIRRVAFETAGLRYDEAMEAAEDYDLWERALHGLRLANVQEVLYQYRLHDSQSSVVKANTQRRNADAIRRRALAEYGIDFTEEEFALHCDIVWETNLDDISRARDALAWLRRLEDEARRRSDEALIAECRIRAKVPRKRLRNAIRRRIKNALIPWR